MAERRASKTADVTAAVRGGHLLYDSQPVLFNDPYALRLTSPGWRTVARAPVLRWLVVSKLMSRLRTVHGEMLARARFGEDMLEQAVGRGVRQYVIVGAGLDSFALRRRDLADQLTVFELDHPASQSAKRERLARLGEEAPCNVVFVPVDFEQETVAAALARSPFDPAVPAFFSWLGVTYYLSPSAVLATLRAIAEVTAPGSEVVLDYCVPADALPPEEQDDLRHVLAFVAKRGEPWRSFFEPSAFVKDMHGLGYEVVADMPPEEQDRLYFRDRSDDLRGPKWSRFAHLRLPHAVKPLPAPCVPSPFHPANA